MSYSGVIIVCIFVLFFPDTVVAWSMEMKAAEAPIVLELPLRGEWMSPNTPGSRVPSHGTDRLGERYAYDFLQVDWERNGHPFYNVSPLRYLLFGTRVEDCYCWGKEIYSPCDAEVVDAADGWEDRHRAYLLVDLFIAIKNALFFNPQTDAIQRVAGNYVVLKYADNVYVAFAHLQKGSLSVQMGSRVKKGQVLGRVGHSGNSTAPHLHFQLMDRRDIRVANGVPCAFHDYQAFRSGGWENVRVGMPLAMERIKYR